MIFDLEMIKKVYGTIKAKVDRVKQICNHPLTLSEKILYSHLWNDKIKKPFIRGKDYVDFAPDRIACQDATAQMALLQFMQAGKKKVAVPTTVHCDHLIQAKDGAIEDLKSACKKNTPEIRVATPYFKPSNNMTKFQPDYYLHKTDKWLVFPHELEGLSIDEIRNHKPELNDLIDKVIASKKNN